MLHIEFKLDTAPAYMGVSYVWGLSQPSKIGLLQPKAALHLDEL
jgi:hypothetical protein